MPQTLSKDKYLERVLCDVSTRYWIWQRYCQPIGYGMTKYKGKMVLVHRLFYTLFVGPIPDGLKVCHTCDVPSCCNPEHLFLGTQKDNVTDMLLKGRNSFRSKLNSDHVLEIRNLFSEGYTVVQLSNRYQVSIQQIQAILANLSWRHVGGPKINTTRIHQRLSKTDALEMLNLKLSGVPVKEIALKFNISLGHAYRLIAQATELGEDTGLSL